jgi:hypothetical protein
LGNLIFTTLYILVGILLGSPAFAQSEVNLLKNPGFESRTSQWSKTGSSTFSIESSAPLSGTYSANWDASATGEFFRSSTYTIPAGLKGVTCVIQMKYLWDTGTSGHILMNVDDGTSNVAQLSLDPTSSATPRTAQVSFTCPTSGTLRFELESTANATQITVDDMFVGTGKSTLQIAQSQLLGAVNYNNAANCEVSTTSGTVAEVADDADCNSRAVIGNASFVNNQFKMRFANGIPAGRYELTTMVPAYVTGASTACEFYIRSTSGVGSNMPAHYAVLDTAGNAQSNPRAQTVNIAWNQTTATTGATDFFMEWRRTSGAGTCFMGTVNAGGATFSMSLKKYPLQSAEALTLETTGWFFDGNIGGANPSLGTVSNATYSQIANSGLDLVLASGSVTGQIACDAAPATGLTCAGNEATGVTLNIPYAGMFEACFSFMHSAQTGAGGSVASIFQVVRTADGSPTIVEEGKSRIQSSNGIASSVIELPHTNCGTFNIPSAGKHSFKLYFEQAASGTIATSLLVADRLAANGQRDIHVTVRPLNQQMPAPVFTEVKKKVNIGTSGQRVEWLHVVANCGADPCTINKTSTTGWATVQRVGAGNYNVIYTGTFSDVPTCIFAGNQDGNMYQNGTTINQYSINLKNSGGTLTDGGFHVMCMGPQ